MREAKEPPPFVVNSSRSDFTAPIRIINDEGGHPWAFTDAYLVSVEARGRFAEHVNLHMEPEVLVTAQMVEPVRKPMGEGNHQLYTIAPLFDPATLPTSPSQAIPPPSGLLARVLAGLVARINPKHPTAV